MNKPIQIVDLEKHYNILLSQSSSLNNSRNTYTLDSKNEIVGLNLSRNGIQDISFLKRFNNITTLDLSFNKISDTKIFNDFVKLLDLNLGYNKISDTSFLYKLIDLEILNLSDNQISDISYLENLKCLKKVNLNGNQISNLPNLENLINLATLDLGENHIYDVSNIDCLKGLTSLNLNNNEISDTFFINNLPSLTKLNLSHNQICDVLIVVYLPNLENLDLSNNHITDISFIENVEELSILNLSKNEILDISLLKKNVKITSLYLNSNQISDISFLESLENLKNLTLSSNQISDIESLKGLTQMESLNLSYNHIENIIFLENLKQLLELNLSNNQISDVSAIKNLKNIEDLNLNGNKEITDISFIAKLQKINYLDLSNNKNISDFSIIKQFKELRAVYLNNVTISDFTFLNNLSKIKTLFLSNNNISDISFLKNLTSLGTLYLNYNRISNIEVIKELLEITSLYLKDNEIDRISSLKNLTAIKILNLSQNKISEIEQFEFISNLPLLNIQAFSNPCFGNNIILDEKGNNYDTILNALKKINESKKMYLLPAKVLFLGNTESGKSTLLDYVLQSKMPRLIKNSLLSTHIVKIETLPRKLGKNAIPKAVFYDFGGQDYYHGLYKAFLSNDSINILLWNINYDKNQIRKDRNDQLTRDYNRDYWLHQLKFQYSKENIISVSGTERTEPILLVQTHADKENHKRTAYKGDCDIFNIKNEFFIALNQFSIENSVIHNIGLRYFEETLSELIRQKQIVKNEPIWYKDFLNYILRTSTQDYTLLSELALEYKRESDRDNLLLPEVLRELAQAGLVLYYKNDIDLKDIVWLDPSKTIQYIHDSILSRNNIVEKKGIVERSILESFTDQKLIKLLLNQKVIFFDEFDDQYIIPGYLCLTEEDDRIYELLTFDFIEPNFIMKFEYFIPFGLINQLICHYGKNKHKKYYWRDQLLFTKDNCKILIKLDFNNLEISVSIKSKKSNNRLNKLEQEIFRDILNLYWDKPRLDENDIDIENLLDGKLKVEVFYNDIPFDSPEDLYISIDNKNFVHHKTLDNKDKTINKIISYGLECMIELQNEKNVEIRKIDITKTKEQASGLYKNFTTNKNTETMKKIFISYAKENKKEVNEFQKQIAPFKLTKEVETWHCSELELGEDWDSKIKNKFYEADIILYFISVDFFSTPFILDEEVKRGIQRDNDPNDNVVLIPIILEKIHWEDLLGKYSSNFKGKAINSYDKSNNAWYEIVDDLKKHHFRKIDSDSTSGILGQSKEKMKAQEDTIAGKL